MKASFSKVFTELGQLLSQTHSIWQPVAFYQAVPQLPNVLAGIEEQIFNLSAQDIESLHFEPSPLAGILQQKIPNIHDLLALSKLPMLAASPVPKVDPRFHLGIPGRKWQQVMDFSACLGLGNEAVLEYCAGKSHLGFYLEHSFGAQVSALEWQHELVEKAKHRAEKEHFRLQSHQVDVMSEACERHFIGASQVLALHACGDLHERMISLCITHKVPQLNLAPCCYHKRQSAEYLPYSVLGKQSQLCLSKADLHTAVMETVTAGNTQIKQRKALQIMRLGFDLLQRDLLSSSEYLPLPSMPLSLSRVSFEDFCRHCAAHHDLALPPNIDWDTYICRAQKRFSQVSAIDVIRALFRRPLEVWLNMDKALYLEASGYEVSLGTFCERRVSPRNILLQAKLS